MGREDVMAARFLRRGGRGSTDTQVLPRSHQLELLPEEKPILISYAPSRAWTALTTLRVIWGSGIPGNTFHVRHNEVKGVRLNLEGSQSKSHIGSLYLTLEDGSTVMVETEPGGACLGVMNVLLFLTG